MKIKNYFKIGLVSLLLMSGLGYALMSGAKAAGSATMSLSPSSGSHQVGSNFTVAIYENSGSTDVYAVQANLTYNASQLQFVSISGSGSAFSGSAQATGGSGSVQIARFVENGQTVSGNRLVARVTFRVLGSSGTTNITFASSSAIVGPSTPQNEGGAWNQSPTGGTYTMTPVPATPDPEEEPEPDENPSPSTGSNNTPKPSNTSTPSNSQTDQTNKPADEPVQVTKDISNTGYPVAIKVLGDNGKAVAGASVSLGVETTTSDEMGIASFLSVPSGTHSVNVEIDGQPSFEKTIDVVDGEPGKVQEFTLSREEKKGLGFSPLALGIGLGAVLLLVGGVALTHFLSNRREANSHIAKPITSTYSSQIDQRLDNIKEDTPGPSQVIAPNKQQDQ